MLLLHAGKKPKEDEELNKLLRELNSERKLRQKRLQAIREERNIDSIGYSSEWKAVESKKKDIHGVTVDSC